MVKRTVQIFMKIPDIAQPFGIYTSSYDVGRVGDSGVTILKFDRPNDYIDNNLRILMKVGYNDPISIDLGSSNELTLTSNLTSATSFVLQVAFTENDNIITISNKLTFYLTSSISPDSAVIVPDYLQELLQFAISQKQNQMEITKTVDPDDSTKITYNLVAFNNSGDQIVNIELPDYVAHAGIADNSEYSKELGKFVVTGSSSDTRLLGVSFQIPVNLLQSTNLHLMYRGSKINSVSVSTLVNNVYSFSNQTYLSSTVFPELKLVLERSISGVITPLYTFSFKTYGTIDSNNYYGVLKLEN